MDYVRLGSSGLEVSRFGLGSAMFGTRISAPDVARLIGEFHDRGGAFRVLLDLADDEHLGGGKAVGNLPRAIRAHRRKQHQRKVSPRRRAAARYRE